MEPRPKVNRDNGTTACHVLMSVIRP